VKITRRTGSEAGANLCHDGKLTGKENGVNGAL
jgi:hypothetical protein